MTDDPVRDPVHDATWDPVSLGGVTELRVHGVGGTPPRVMLETPDPVQVSGDEVAGCFRRPSGTSGPTAGDHRVEAYAWGGLTGRSWRSAFWLLALPFAMVNVAGWMSPRRGDPTFGAVVRVAGLVVTAVYVAFACTAGMDFLAYQCAGAEDAGRSCSASGWWPIGVGGPAHDPIRRVIVGAAVPLALLGFLWWATRQSRQAYEEYGSDAADVNTEMRLMAHARQGLEHPRFWRGEGYAARLAEVHLGVGFAIVAFLIAATTTTFSDSPSAPALAAVAFASMLAGLVLAAVTRIRRRLRRRLVLGVCLAQVVLAGLVGWFAQPVVVSDPPTALPGSTAVFKVFIGLLVPLAGAVFLTALLATRRRKGISLARRLRWATTPTATVISGFLVSLTVLAGIVLWWAGLLGVARAYRVDEPTPAIEYAQSFEVLARGVVVSAVVVVVTLGVVWLVRGRREGQAGLERSQEGWRDIPCPPGWNDARTSRAWTHVVRRSCRIPAASLSAVEWALWVTAWAALPAALVYGLLWLRALSQHGWRAQHIDVGVGPLAAIPLSFCTWVLAAVPLVAIAVLRRAIVNPSTRRSLAIAWDVATFWPRSFHPLAPPSYAERAVPELQARLRRLWEGDRAHPGSVLLLGHSQGSVLVAAALASLDVDACPDDPRPLRERLSVITYGSPVRRLYARHFPGYFTYGLIVRLLESLCDPSADDGPSNGPGNGPGNGPRKAPVAWRNFYRDTDYVGHRLTEEPWATEWARVDSYLLDPPHPFTAPEDPRPPVRAHAETGYRRQLRFRRRVAEETVRMRSSAATSGPAVVTPRQELPTR